MPWTARDHNFNQLMGKEKHEFVYWQLINQIPKLAWRLRSTRSSPPRLLRWANILSFHFLPCWLYPICILLAAIHYIHLVGVLWVTQYPKAWKPIWLDDKSGNGRNFMNYFTLLSDETYKPKHKLACCDVTCLI